MFQNNTKFKMWLTEAYYEKMLKLIKSVHERPCLWNVAHEHYYNRNLTRQLWSEVEDECNMEPGSAARRWKNMKDTYRKEFRKGIEKSTWLYSKHMTFLQTVIGTTNIRSNMILSKDDNEQSTDEVIFMQTTDNDSQAENQNAQQQNYDREDKESETESTENTITACIPKCMKTNVTLMHNKDYDDNADTNDVHDDNDDNEDYHFLMSCRQYLKKMNDRNKFQFRMEMQQLMFDFVYPDDSQSDDVSV